MTQMLQSQLAKLIVNVDTLIVWTEIRNNIDMALSFQEGDGCAAIWLVYLPWTSSTQLIYT